MTRRGALLACLVASLSGAGATAAPAAPAACAPGPIESAARYYRAVDAKDFPRAWDCLSAATHRQFGGYGHWRSGFRSSRATRLVRVEILDESAARAEISVRLRACRVAGRGAVAETYAGRWDVRRSRGGWRLDRPRIRLVGSVRRGSC